MHLVEGKLTCPDAFVTAAQVQWHLERSVSGDALGVRLARCQLGLFVMPGNMVGDGGVTDLPVPEAWRQRSLRQSTMIDT